VRGTIIGVFAVVVLIVSVLAFAMMRLTIGDVGNKGESQRAVTGAVAQLQVEGLRIERWLAEQASGDDLLEPFKISATEARGNEATASANGLEEVSKNAPVFASVRPSLILMFDKNGVVLGRNGTKLMRGRKLGEQHPRMVKEILAGRTGSEVWVNKKANEQLLASYAPVREGAEILGGVLIGTAFNDERLEAASNATSELPLYAAVKRDGKMMVVARSSKITDAMLAGADGTAQALETDQVVGQIPGLAENLDGAAKALEGYGEGNEAVISSVTEAKTLGSFGSLFWPFLGVFLLGLVLTGVASHLINNYIAQPISDLEDGLLAVINGQTDIRFELEHKMLGGLVYQVNSLLNQLLDVKEDDTDDEGRPSVAPSSTSFTAALNVDERMVSLSLEDVEDGHTLRDEAPEDYYKRIFDEYIAAKKKLGDPTDSVKFAGFKNRIAADEAKFASTHGKPFRFRVEPRAEEVVLVAIPLA
jgi:hypothetical protein